MIQDSGFPRWLSLAAILLLAYLAGTVRIAAQSDRQRPIIPRVPMAAHTGQALSGTAGSANEQDTSAGSPLVVASSIDASVQPAASNPIGITYTCDASIPASVCQTLNTT